MATYKAIMRSALEYGSSIWLPLTSSTRINKLHAALRTATGCSQDTNMQHLHDKNTHTSHTQAPTAPHLIIQTYITTSISSPTQTHNILQPSKALKPTIFNNGSAQQTFPQIPTQSLQCHIHISIVSSHLATRGNIKIRHTPPPH